MAVYLCWYTHMNDYNDYDEQHKILTSVTPWVVLVLNNKKFNISNPLGSFLATNNNTWYILPLVSNNSSVILPHQINNFSIVYIILVWQTFWKIYQWHLKCVGMMWNYVELWETHPMNEERRSISMRIRPQNCNCYFPGPIY